VSIEKYPRVTQILSILQDFSKIKPADLEYAAERGRLVHEMIHLSCLNELDDINLCEALLPYYGAWQEFLVTTGFQVLESEKAVCDDTLKYRGTLDLVGMLNGRRTLIDIKTRKHNPIYDGPQTAAYRGAWDYQSPFKKNIQAQRILSLTTKKDKYGQIVGKYKLTPELKNGNDYRIFMACLAIHNHKKGA